MSAVPKLRFPEFTKPVGQGEISDFCEIISGYPVDSDDILETPNNKPLLRGINITEGRIRHSEKIDRYFGNYNASLDKYLVRENDVVIGMDGSKVGKNIARITAKDEGAFLIQRVALLRQNTENSIEYAYQILTSKKFRRYVEVVNTSSGIPHISLKQIREFKLGKPIAKEQKKIAGFLGAVDDKIAGLRERESLLTQYKKGVMQKIFTQDIRFKADDGSDFPDWEKSSIGEISKVEMGQSPDSRAYNDTGDGIPLIQGNADIKNRVTTPRQWTSEITKLGNSGSLVLSVRAPVGEIGKIDQQVCLGRGVCSLTAIKSNCVEFIYQWLLAHENVWRRIEQGSTFSAVSGSDIRGLKLSIPHPDEQQKIADFLSAIDAKITAVSAQITQMQDFKKGLLQQMFV